MSAARIEAVLDCQAKLIAAIDRHDAGLIVGACEALAAAVARLGDAADWPTDGSVAPRIHAALEQNGAALRRLNLFRHWTRQRIDRVNELRSGNF